MIGKAQSVAVVETFVEPAWVRLEPGFVFEQAFVFGIAESFAPGFGLVVAPHSGTAGFAVVLVLAGSAEYLIFP